MKRVAGQAPLPAHPTIAAIAAKWIGVAAAITIFLQTAICLAENFFDEAYYVSWYVKIETEHIAALLERGTRSEAPPVVPVPAHYIGPTADRYGFRVFDADGRLMGGHNGALLAAVSPISSEGAAFPESWNARLGDEWFHAAGGRKRTVAGRPVWIEVATLGDPGSRRLAALAADLYRDV